MTNNIQNPVTGNGTGADSQNEAISKEFDFSVSLSLHENGKIWYKTIIKDLNTETPTKEQLVSALERQISRMSWGEKYQINWMLDSSRKLFV